MDILPSNYESINSEKYLDEILQWITNTYQLINCYVSWDIMSLFLSEMEKNNQDLINEFDKYKISLVWI